MIMPMAKVQVIGAKTDFYQAVTLLHDLGAVHLEDANAGKITAEPGAPAPLYERMSLDAPGEEKKRLLDETLIKLNAVLSGLPEAHGQQASTELGEHQSSFSELDALSINQTALDFLSEIEEPSRELANRRANLSKELAQADKYESILEQFYPLLEKFSPVAGFESIALLIEQRHRGLLDLIDEELTEMTGGKSVIAATDIGEDMVAVMIMFSSEYAEQIRRLLWEEKVNEVRLPESIADKPFEQAVGELRLRQQRIPLELAEVETELSKISAEWWSRLRAARDVIVDQLEQLKGVIRFGQTGYTFVMKGWVPKERVSELTREFDDRFAGRALVEEQKVEEWEIDDVPISLQNGRMFKPYEFLLNFFQLPRYGSIDPSSLLGIFFLFFFGLIVGDIAYGLIIIAFAWWLRRKFAGDGGRMASNIFIGAGISSVIFGVIFGEFFGPLLIETGIIQPTHIAGFELPIERTKDTVIMPLLIFTAAIGALHLLLGLTMGAIVSYKYGAKKHLAERVGMILLLFCGGIFILTAANVIPGTLNIAAWLLLVLGLAGLFYAGGPGMLPMHIIDLIRNVASYTRLMALGLAGAFLALVANDLGAMTGNLFLGILVAGVLHLLNLVISVFSPTLHSLRLNFLEFFSTFYESGGKPYSPFKRAAINPTEGR